MRNSSRLLVVGLLMLTLHWICLPSKGSINPKEFRIGYQKAANTLVLLKAHGTLEQRLRPLGIEVKWLEAELAPIQGLEPEVIEASLRHYQHLYRPIDDTVLTDQQKIADAFFELGLIPKKIAVRDAVLPASR
jgi:sulfonate transport system substrate-binding protein